MGFGPESLRLSDLARDRVASRATTSPPHISTAPSPDSRAASYNGMSSAEQRQGNATPPKTFMHVVLHRLRTSCSVLQTALCYIEAVRPLIPELVHQDQTV